MKKLLMAAALIATAISGHAETKQALTLHMESGAKIVYFLDTEPSIGFSGQSMVVTVGDEATDIPMQDVNHWEIGLADDSSVESIADAGNVGITVRGNSVTILNPQGLYFTIYNIGGQTVATGSETEATFTLPRDIYVITIANNNYKIAIR